MRKIIVGTRASNLAVTQTNWVIDQLKNVGVQHDIEIKTISTKGDRKTDVALSKVGGTGIFSDDIEAALANKDIDFAVHSLKDLPVEMKEEFTIAAFPKREDHRDAFIGGNEKRLEELPAGAVIGTSSARRAAQIKALNPDIKTAWIRGAVDQRLEQLENGKYDGIILAVAGLKRLGLEHVIAQYLPADHFVPAVGQGALAIQCRRDDTEVMTILQTINDEETEVATRTERLLIRQLDKEDQAPIGAYAEVVKGKITLYCSVASVDGNTVISAKSTGTSPQAVAKACAEQLIKKGALSLIEQAKLELTKE